MSASAIRADDRILALDVLPLPDMAALGRILMQGSMVVLGTRDAIDEGRRHLAEFDNVLFIENEGARVPWRDSYFTVIIVPSHFRSLQEASSAEWARLLAPNGRIVFWEFRV